MSLSLVVRYHCTEQRRLFAVYGSQRAVKLPVVLLLSRAMHDLKEVEDARVLL
jgi:hypothetical protein